ncbi:MAG: alanyl-tRNA editing protein [Pseudomonadota bacterium]
MSTQLLYLEDPSITESISTVRALRVEASGLAVVLDTSPYFPKGGGQPSDEGWITGPNGRVKICRVSTAEDGVWHYGEIVDGEIAEGDRVIAAIDVEVRLRNARLHSGGEAICAAIYELGKRWQVTAASHVPGQSRVAFMTDLDGDDLPGFLDQLKRQVADIVERDEPVLTFLDVPEEEVRRLCPLDADDLTSKMGGLRLVSPVRGFHRPCMGAHVTRTGEIGAIEFRKVRIRNGDLSISYDLG